jgi:eukaryotic-like serine/threonine-protein kinase
MEPSEEIDHYRIDKLLGRGGMGEVYLATDLKLNRPVALKILPKGISEDKIRVDRFRREALATSALSHPNICSIYDVGESNGYMYIAMEYIEGVALTEKIRTGAIETNEVIDIGIQIADALEEARKKNIVHRDIKSSNILLTPRKQVKLLDFGLAKTVITADELSHVSTESHLTKVGTVLGTVSYMSPEQALGHAVDHRSDIFSFGVVLYEMLTTKLPFSGKTQTEIIDAVLHKDAPPMSRFNDKVPAKLNRVIQKMLQKDIDERYQSVHEVWSDLRHIRNDDFSSTHITKTDQLPWKTILIAALLIAIMVESGLLIFQQKTSNISLSASNIVSIVALPCKVYGSSDVAYLTDAVPSTLSTLLGQIQGLETKMPPSSVEVQQVNGDLNKIADVYHVNAFLISSVTSQGQRLTINLQLIDPNSRGVLWSKQYEGTRSTYNQITQQAADDIRQVLRPISSAITTSNGVASTSEAELAFRQGLHYSYQYNRQRKPNDFDEAFKSFKRSFEFDPRFADAAAEIAWLYGMKSEEDNSPEKSLIEANRWARQALAINDHCSKGWSALYGSDFEESLQYALRAVKYGPKDTYAHNTLGYFLNYRTIILAERAYQTASALDPLYLSPAGNEAILLMNMGKYNEALSKTNQLLTLEPNFGLSNKVLILAYLDRKKELMELVPQLERSKNEEKLSSYKRDWTNYVIAATADQKMLAETRLNEIKKSFTSRSDFYFWMVANSNLIPFLIHEHKIEDAIYGLNKELEFDQTVPYELFLQNPYYKTLRNEPRLQEHIKRSKAKLAETISLLDKAQKNGELPQYLEKPLSELRVQISEL